MKSSVVWCPLLMFLVYPPAGVLYGTFMCCIYDRRRRAQELMENEAFEEFLDAQAADYTRQLKEGLFS